MAKRIVLLLVVAALAGGGWYWYQSQQRREDGVITLYGNVDVRPVELAFRVAGRIDEVLVDEGDTVDAGDLVGRRRRSTASAPASASTASPAWWARTGPARPRCCGCWAG